MRRDQPQLTDLGLQGMRALDRLDPDGGGQHLGDPGAFLARREVAAYPGADVLGRPDIQRAVVGGPEDVDPRHVRQAIGQVPLPALGRGDRLGELDGVAERVHLEAAQPLDQPVQDVDGGPGVVQRPVGRLHGGVEELGEGGQLAVGHLVAGQRPAGHRGGVQHPDLRPGVAVPVAGRLEEADVVRRVVRHQHRPAQELQQAGQHRLDRRGRGQHRLGDAGQHGDERRQPLARVYQGGEDAQPLAGAHLDRADLGDPAAVRRAAGGLQVEHHERRVDQRHRRGVDRAVGAQEGVQSALHVSRLCHGAQIRRGVRQNLPSAGKRSLPSTGC